MVGFRNVLALPDHPVARLEVATNMAGLGLLAYGIVTTTDLGRHGGMAVTLPLLGLCVLGWGLWLGARAGLRSNWVRAGSLLSIAVCGGGLVGTAPLAMVFGAVATMGACTAWPLRQAASVGLASLGATLVSVPLAGRPWSVLLGAVSAVLAGSVIGVNRRVAQQRALDTAAVALAEANAEAEAARAELLAGRNHLARELHDVLAHTLSAVSLQLEALGAQVGETAPAMSSKLEEIKGLVREGLMEARGAVAALREDLPPLEERLRSLAAQRSATFEAAGASRPLPADVSLSLYRVAQEALTNVTKHAPGTTTAVKLTFGPEALHLSVTNSAPRPAPEQGTAAVPRVPLPGGGYGLQGIRERVLLIGGTVETGPTPAGGWEVVAGAPYARPGTR